MNLIESDYFMSSTKGSMKSGVHIQSNIWAKNRNTVGVVYVFANLIVFK